MERRQQLGMLRSGRGPAFERQHADDRSRDGQARRRSRLAAERLLHTRGARRGWTLEIESVAVLVWQRPTLEAYFGWRRGRRVPRARQGFREREAARCWIAGGVRRLGSTRKVTGSGMNTTRLLRLPG
ncbi:glycine-rich cell wall structural protein 1.0-like [Iris pallida]|uniref:Glycine-rich cell wall structural protein 1.0-like n=1 Tax=Iris pallida TaxID=29817 RepID=A0AAX6EM86_IRIPA|nr:glycine-rich cell wall structural protein 1.0-like [Iris pallida]